MVPSKNSKTAHFPLKLLLCCKNKDIILKTVSFPKNSPKQKDLRSLANVWPMCFNGTMEVSCIKWPETSCLDFYLIQFCLPFHGKGKKKPPCFLLFSQSVSTWFHPSITKLWHSSYLHCYYWEKTFPVKILSNQWGLFPPRENSTISLKHGKSSFHRS